MKRMIRWKVVTVGVLVSGLATAAGVHDIGHGLGSDSDDSMATQMDAMSEHMEGMGHAHDEWVDPPPEYNELSGGHWTDLDAIKRGRQIFEAQCASCHGVDGQLA